LNGNGKTPFQNLVLKTATGGTGQTLFVSAIDALGYNTVPDGWGCHNYLIMDIEKDGKSILFDDYAVHGMRKQLPA
jgi:hypothetical protein